MKNVRTLRLSLVMALAAALTATPLVAQGKGKGQEKERKQREEWVRRDSRWEDDVRLERRERGPAFCRSGEGHPVHGRSWCVEKGFGLGEGRYDDRYDRRDDRYGTSGDGRYGSYEAEHSEFHRYLDRKYSALSAQRPLDLQWQIRIRAEKKAEHDRWHAQAGRRH